MFGIRPDTYLWLPVCTQWSFPSRPILQIHSFIYSFIYSIIYCTLKFVLPSPTQMHLDPKNIQESRDPYPTSQGLIILYTKMETKTQSVLLKWGSSCLLTMKTGTRPNFNSGGFWGVTCKPWTAHLRGLYGKICASFLSTFTTLIWYFLFFIFLNVIQLFFFLWSGRQCWSDVLWGRKRPSGSA